MLKRVKIDLRDPEIRHYAEATCTPVILCTQEIMVMLDLAASRANPNQQALYHAFQAVDSQAELADVMGVTKTAITYRLKGNPSRPKLPTLWEAILSYLGPEERWELNFWIKLLKRYQITDMPSHEETNWQKMAKHIARLQ